MVMVHGIVAHGDGPGVQVESVGFLGGFDGHRVDTSDTPCLAVIGEEREPVLRRKDVVGNADPVKAQLVLQEIDETQGAEFRIPDNVLPFSGRHVQVFREIVVGAYGPVEHDVPVRQPAVGKHHFRAPELLPLWIESVPVVRQGIVAGVPVQVDVVAYRLFHGYGRSIFFEDGDISEVLGRDAVLEFFGTCHFRDDAQLGPVDEDPGPCLGSVREGEDPSAPAAVFHLPDRQPGPYFHTGLVSHVPEDFRADGRIEQDVGHPA